MTVEHGVLALCARLSRWLQASVPGRPPGQLPWALAAQRCLQRSFRMVSTRERPRPSAASAAAAAGMRSGRGHRSEGVLQPDVTFTAPPILQMLHGQLFACCAMISLVFLSTALPLARPEGQAKTGTWLKVFLPLIFYTLASMGVHCAYIVARRRCLRMQLGPEPDASITVAAATVQWAVLHRCFSRQHVASNASDITLLAGVLCSLSILLASLRNSGGPAYQTAAMPLAVAEFLVLCIHTMYRVRCAPAPRCAACHKWDESLLWLGTLQGPASLAAQSAQSMHQGTLRVCVEWWTHACRRGQGLSAAACRRRGPVPTASTRSDILIIWVFLVAFKIGENISIGWPVRRLRVVTLRWSWLAAPPPPLLNSSTRAQTARASSCAAR